MAPVAAAVLPHPPLLVPELAGAAAAELDPLRAACHEALSTVAAAADLTIVVGDGPVWATPDPAAPGSFHPYGADVEVALPALADLDLRGLPPPARLSDLPLSLAVAAHLLQGLDRPPGRLCAATVPRSLGPRAAAAIGHALAAAGEFGLVVMADLSARRTERAPGAFGSEAADFDARVAEAFRTGAPHHLLTLDPAQSAALLAAGRVPLQVLAGAFEQGPAPGNGPPDEPGPAHRAGGPAEADPAVGRETQQEIAPGGRGGTQHETASSVGGRVQPKNTPGVRGRVQQETASGVGGEVQHENASGVGGLVQQEHASGLRGRVLYEDAPYGVGYLVALLTAP